MGSDDPAQQPQPMTDEERNLTLRVGQHTIRSAALDAVFTGNRRTTIENAERVAAADCREWRVVSFAADGLTGQVLTPAIVRRLHGPLEHAADAPARSAAEMEATWASIVDNTLALAFISNVCGEDGVVRPRPAEVSVTARLNSNFQPTHDQSTATRHG
jgi:hypothetical protein